MEIKKDETVIIPVRIDDYEGKDTWLSVDDSMWIAVHMKNSKILQDLTDYGYRSLEELKDAYKDMKIIETE